VRVVGDPSIPLAGCRLDRGLGQASFSVEEQMEEIRLILNEMNFTDEETEDLVDESRDNVELEPVQTDPQHA